MLSPSRTTPNSTVYQYTCGHGAGGQRNQLCINIAVRHNEGEGVTRAACTRNCKQRTPAYHVRKARPRGLRPKTVCIVLWQCAFSAHAELPAARCWLLPWRRVAP